MVAEIDENDWIAHTDELWDLEYKPHRLKIWHEKRNIGLEVSYCSDSDEIRVRGNFYKYGNLIRSTPSKVEFGGRSVIMGNTVVDEAVLIGADYHEDEDFFVSFVGGKEHEIE